MARTLEQVIAECGMFRGMSPAMRQVLERLAQRKHYKAGTTIFMQGQPCPGMYIVDSGQVRVYRQAANGQEHVLHLCGPNQTFAEVAAIGDFQLPASARATTATVCVLIPRDLLQRELAHNHELCRQMLTGMAFWVRHFVNLLEDIVLHDAMGRVARLLVSRMKVESEIVTLPGAKKDIASHLNLTSETLSRVLRRLIETQVIEKDKRSLRIVNRQRLHVLAKG